MEHTNANSAAFPCEQGIDPNGCWNQTFEPGLTKREYFATMALSAAADLFKGAEGISREQRAQSVAGYAVALADALFAELNKTKETSDD